MTQNPRLAGGRLSIQRCLLIVVLCLLLFLPLLLSNHPTSTAADGLLLAVIFFFPGYLLLAVFHGPPFDVRMAASAVFGLVCITTAYDVFALASIGSYFPLVLVLFSISGIVLFLVQSSRTKTWFFRTSEASESLLAGGLVALSVAPLFWRSGRFSAGEFVFHGPAGQDQLFHVTMVQRLLHHIPPDNFMFSGLRATVYHYFDDLALVLVLQVQQRLRLGSTELFDLFYRCYPTLIYFLIGVLAYSVGRQLLRTVSGGMLSVLLLLGAGGLGWFFGALQTLIHAKHLVAMRAALFTTWTAWDRVDVVRPLIHRPAHYHSLLICLAALSVLLQRERTRRHWIIAGLLLGLMAGFNFTLSATFGAAAVLATCFLFLQRRHEDARNLAWLAACIFLGSLPVNAVMLLSGFHTTTPGFPFRGPNLEFPAATWGVYLARMLPAKLVPAVSLLLFPIAAYGIKLFGIPRIMRFDLGEERHRGLAIMLALAFAISFVVGVFFPYQAVDIGIIFLQPTFWMLGLFALRPLDAWLTRNRGNWRAAVLWGILGLTWAQALMSFNFSCEAVFDAATTRALLDVRDASAPDDVVAYLPTTLTAKPIWGYPEQSTNFSIMAMTGLDGYFSSEEYSIFHAVPGLSGSTRAEVLAKAERLYQQRRADIDLFIKGEITEDASRRLENDHVRWIVVSGNAPRDISSSITPWRRTDEVVIYRLAPQTDKSRAVRPGRGEIAGTSHYSPAHSL